MALVSSAGAPEEERLLQESEEPHAGRNDVESVGQVELDAWRRMDLLPLIQAIHQDIVKAVDVSMTSEQLRRSELYIRLIRPILRKYGEGLVPCPSTRLHDDEVYTWTKTTMTTDWIRSKALPYAFLINRLNFQLESESDVARGPILDTRAAFAETLAIKILRYFDLDRELPLALTTRLTPYNSMSDLTNLMNVDDVPSDLSVLELAIVTSAKPFIASSLVQSVLSRLWSGGIVLYPKTRKAILHDSYKLKPDVVFRIPRFRYLVETYKMLLLLIVFLLTLWLHSISRMTIVEFVFILVAAGHIQDEMLQLHDAGASMYMANQSNSLDLGIGAVFFLYFILRIASFIALSSSDDSHLEFGMYLGKLSFDILSLTSVMLFPRAALLYLRQNVLLIAIKSMVWDFCLFIVLAALMAMGFVVCFLLLARGHLGDVGGYEHVLSICLQVFLGSSYLGWTVASDLHPVIGPPLMLAYAVFCQFFLITTLISVLSNTFAKVVTHSTEELLFSQAIRVFENLQTDPLMLYQAPFNLFVLPLLLPLRSILSERAFHRVNKFLTRLTNLHLLLLMWLWERYELATQPNQPRSHPEVGKKNYSRALNREITLPALILNETSLDPSHRSVKSSPLTASKSAADLAEADPPDPKAVKAGATEGDPVMKTSPASLGFGMLNPFRVLSRDGASGSGSGSTPLPNTVASATSSAESIEARLERMEAMLQRLLRNNLPNSTD